MKKMKKKKGASLLIVIGIMVFVSFLVVTMYSIFNSNTHAISRDVITKELFYHTRTGVEIAETTLYANGKDGKPEKLFNDLIDKKIKVPPLKDTFTYKDFKISSSDQYIDEDGKKRKFSFPKDIEISVEIGYVDKNTAARRKTAKEKKRFAKHVDTVYIVSIAKNIKTKKSQTLYKFIDPTGLNTSYE